MLICSCGQKLLCVTLHQFLKQAESWIHQVGDLMKCKRQIVWEHRLPEPCGTLLSGASFVKVDSALAGSRWDQVWLGWVCWFHRSERPCMTFKPVLYSWYQYIVLHQYKLEGVNPIVYNLSLLINYGFSYNVQPHAGLCHTLDLTRMRPITWKNPKNHTNTPVSLTLVILASDVVMVQ